MNKRSQCIKLAFLIGTLAAVAGLLLPVCRAGDPADQAPPPRELQGAVLILLDTVRADHLSCYGYRRSTSPKIDQLARRGVRFTQAVSCSPWTLPAVAGLLTAEHPERVFNSRLQRSLVSQLQQAGFKTAAITEGGFLSRSFGFDLGFDLYEEEEGAVQLLNPGQKRNPNARGGIEHTFSRAKKWLREHRNERFFLLIHTYEPHTPYSNRDFVGPSSPGRIGPVFRTEMLNVLQQGRMTLTAGELEYLKALYDGDILNSDRHVGDFIEFLESCGLNDNTLVVLTSDHGEELNDHFPAFTGDHGHSLRDPLLRVPLIIHDPLHRYANKKVSAQVRLLDVMPTIAELLGVALGRPVNGLSLLPLMNGSESTERIVISGQTKTGPPRYSIRSQGYKFIAIAGPRPPNSPPFPALPSGQLYDLTKDPGELKNLAQARPKLVLALQQQLQKEINGMNGQVRPRISTKDDAELIERLKSLGYLQ